MPCVRWERDRHVASTKIMPASDAFRVLVVSSKYPPEYAGSGLRAHCTYQRLAAKFGVEFDVLTGSVESNTSGSYVHEGVQVQRIARKLLPASEAEGQCKRLLRFVPGPAVRRLNYWSEAASTFRFLRGRRSQYDAIHVFGNVSVTSAAISFARAFRVPFIVEMTSDRSNPHGWEPWIVARLWGVRLPEWSRIVCISERLRRMCEAHGYVDNVWSRPNPVDESRFFPEHRARLAYRRRLTAFGDTDVVLSYVAKFMPSKNQCFLVEMLSHLPDRFKLVLAGPVSDSGPLAERDARYLASVRQTIAELGFEERVQVIAEFVDAHELMKASDVYVFPSVNEGLGTPVIEAIACGIPVVANRMEGITDQWITEGESGFLSGLAPAEFAARVDAAAKIEPKALLRRSSEILGIASSEVIDRKYWELLQEVRDTTRRKMSQPV